MTSLPACPALCPSWTPTPSRRLDTSLGWGAYALGMRRWLSPTTHELYPRYENYSCAREALGLAPGGPQLAVLVGYGEDPLVEAFWTRRFELGLIERLADQQWDLVLSTELLHVRQPTPHRAPAELQAQPALGGRARRCGRAGGT